MSKSEFTPGEWSANGLHIMCEGKNGPIGQSFVMSFSHDYRGKRLPDTEGGSNARMFAASPNLLNALQNILDFPPGDLTGWIELGKPITITILPSHVSDALEAINKALNI